MFSATPAAAAPDLAEHVLPAELCGRLWLVTITYHEGPRGSLLMVLDTGAGRSSVDPDAVHRVFGKRLGAGKRINLKRGAAGALELRKLEVELHSMDHLSRALGHEIDGILGFPAFRSLLLTLDYPRGEVRVRRGALPAVDGRTILEDVGKNRPYLVFEIGGARLPVLIDSGSTGSFRLQAEDPVNWMVAPRPISASVGYDEIRIDRAGRAADALRLGTLQIEQPLVVVSGRTRLLGERIMNRFVWTFDQQRRRIRLLADSEQPIRDASLRGPGLGFTPVEGGFEVIAVFPDTPAARADIEKGDRLVSVDGVAVTERGCRKEAFWGERQTALLGLIRNGAPHAVEVQIEELVP